MFHQCTIHLQVTFFQESRYKRGPAEGNESAMWCSEGMDHGAEVSWITEH